jgi:hypothetical protein
MAATIFIVPLAPQATKADNQQYSVVARVGAKSVGLTSRDIVVRVENVNVSATAIKPALKSRETLPL